MKKIKEIITKYKMSLGANVSMEGNDFKVEVLEEFRDIEKCIYMFVVGKEIVRIGNSKAKFYQRMRAYELHISKSLEGRKSPTPLWEAKDWKERMDKHKKGFVYVREGWKVETPIGEFNSYMSEESELIGKHLPPLNRSKHR
tara:strand:+ start:288 stop:713 length:426 start_codon:yes stop_codon:yes gene_type:complete